MSRAQVDGGGWAGLECCFSMKSSPLARVAREYATGAGQLLEHGEMMPMDSSSVLYKAETRR